MQESGFVHSAFTFSHESMFGRSGQRTADKSLPPGALLTFLQKGLQYVGVEESLRQQQEHAKKSSNSSRKGHANPTSGLSTAAPSDGLSAVNGEFSLLSPIAISAITRRNPPIQLTVPPAAAAAAVRARLEMEARQAVTPFVQTSGLPKVEPPLVVESHVAPHFTSKPFSSTKTGTGEESNRANIQLNIPSAFVRGAVAVRSQQPQLSPRNGNSLPDNHLDPLAMVDGDSEVVSDPQSQTYSTKRNASESKRNSKKQKTLKNGEPVVVPLQSTTWQGIDGVMETAGKNLGVKEETSANEMNKVEEKRQEVVHPDLHSENDQYAESRQHLPAHTGQQSWPPPSHLLQVGALNGDVVKNRTDTISKSSFQPIQELNGQDDSKPESEEFNSSRNDNDMHLIKDEEILTLSKHQSEVFMCAWNPVYTSLIATGSGDASARIWEMNGTSAKDGLKGCILLPHGIDSGDRKNKDVTTLEWSAEGTLLATGSYDGLARVWDRKGTLVYTLKGHQGPIFSLKWNKRGNFLLSGSYDKTIIVWNVSSGGSGFIEHQFKDHDAPALDVDWKDDTTFASCSTDRSVHIYDIHQDTPIKVYTGHTDEVNAVKWDFSGKLLASCSDDCTAKVWEIDSDRQGPLHDFVSHNLEIYTVKWSPTGPGSPNPDKTPLLATASFDGSIRLWNVRDGSCCRHFHQHRESVYSVSFSPSGDFLASGSLAGQMYIWNIKEDRFVKSYKGNGDIFEVAWNKEETRVAACFSSNVVTVIDFDPSKYRKLTGMEAL